MSRQHTASRTLIAKFAVGALLAASAISLVQSGCITVNPGESPPDLSAPITFSQDIQPIFDKRCGVCHRAGGIAAIEGIRMRLTSGASYQSLVNQPSSRYANWTLVVPFDASVSLLYRKVHDPVPPAGFRMPLLQPPLSDAEITLIREWIDSGAPNN